VVRAEAQAEERAARIEVQAKEMKEARAEAAAAREEVAKLQGRLEALKQKPSKI
jgi:hypothetical protein